MDGLYSSRPGGAAWSMEEIPYHAVDRALLRDHDWLFYVIASASFVEITSDLYTRNLIEYYDGDEEVMEWLAEGWEPEELQHGAALRRYVETAWPDFDWETSYRNFLAEYSKFCVVDDLAPTRALEMAARCVVETGTATFYRALAEISPEPVLTQLVSNISADEVRHYKHFFRYFQRYRETEQPGRIAVARTLYQRIAEIDDEDAFCAFKHVFLSAKPGAEFHESDYVEFRRGIQKMAKTHYPYDMGLKMMLKPLDLNPSLVRVMSPPMVSAARFLFLR